MAAHTLAAGILLLAQTFGLGPDGFFLGAKDSGFQLRIRGVVQGDGRFFLGDDANLITDQFLVRRARLYIEGTAGQWFDYRLMPDFGEGKLQLLDAWVNIRPWPWLQLRGGKFKSPFGLSRLQEERNLVFVERGLPSSLAPDRDVGVAIHGELTTIAWQLGVFNGVADGASFDGDTSDGKDFEARVFAKPIREIGFGIAATWGTQHGNTSSNYLPAAKTAGQNTWFAYASDALADGDHSRISPQAYAYVGPFGVLAEYVRSTQRIVRGASSGNYTNDAWQVETSFVVTLEKASYAGIEPKHPFDPRKFWFGAFEIGARYGELHMDNGLFPRFADPSKSPRGAYASAFVANWYMTRNVRAEVQFEHTVFTGAARSPENVVLGRLQVAF
jgi:phosphate-selective porin OprO/OprP